MHFVATSSISWPEAVAAIGFFVAISVLIGGGLAAFVELRKTRIAAGQREEMQQLVRRYEHLAEATMDAQQRVAADVSELRSRTTAIEQILRSVE